MKEQYSDNTGKEGGMDYQDLLDFIKQIESDPANHRIDPLDFVGMTSVMNGQKVELFPKAEVEHDLARVANKKSEIMSQFENLSRQEKDQRITADFVETMMPVAITELGWLGDRVRVIHPSLFDDFFNGIDMAIQINPDKEIESERDMRCLGFSVDFTVSHSQAQKKFMEELIRIAKGRVPAMKYFKTSFETSRGPRDIQLKNFKIPKVILTCNGEALENAEEDFMSFEDKPDDPEVKNRASENPLRYFFIKETQVQLRFYRDVSKVLGNERAHDMYDLSLQAFEEMIAELGLNQNILAEKTKNMPSLVSGQFDIKANSGQLIEIIKYFSANSIKE